MRIFNISQVLQERMPGFHRRKFNLNKFYLFLAFSSFGLSVFAFYIYFSTFETSFQPFKSETDFEEIIRNQSADAQILDTVQNLKQETVFFPAREFFKEDLNVKTFPIDIADPIFLGRISLKKRQSYLFSINFPRFVQSNSLYFKNKSMDQFEKQKNEWKDLNKIKNIPTEKNGKTIYPAGLIADTLPFDRIILVNTNGNVFEPKITKREKIDGKKVVIQDNISNIVLPLSWKINNSTIDDVSDESVTSSDGNSFLPKSFIKNSRLIDWISIGSFPGYNLNIGKIENLESGDYSVFLLDYNINENYLANRTLKDRKFRIQQKRIFNVNTLALPIFLIINGLIMVGLAILL